jgi:hypothetical protein
MTQGPHRSRRFSGLQVHGRGHRRTIHVDMGMQDHVPGFIRIDIRRLAHLGQINLTIRSPMMMRVLMIMIDRHIRMMMLRPDLMRMRLRPGRRPEPGKHGNQQKCQSVPHRPPNGNQHTISAAMSGKGQE